MRGHSCLAICHQEVEGLQGGNAEGTVSYSRAIGGDVTRTRGDTPPPHKGVHHNLQVDGGTPDHCLIIKGRQELVEQAISSWAPCGGLGQEESQAVDEAGARRAGGLYLRNCLPIAHLQ